MRQAHATNSSQLQENVKKLEDRVIDLMTQTQKGLVHDESQVEDTRMAYVFISVACGCMLRSTQIARAQTQDCFAPRSRRQPDGYPHGHYRQGQGARRQESQECSSDGRDADVMPPSSNVRGVLLDL